MTMSDRVWLAAVPDEIGPDGTWRRGKILLPDAFEAAVWALVADLAQDDDDGE